MYSNYGKGQQNSSAHHREFGRKASGFIATEQVVIAPQFARFRASVEMRRRS
jgi:hypothetical protein